MIMAEQGFEFDTDQWQAWCLLCGRSRGVPYNTADSLCPDCVEQYQDARFFRRILRSNLALSFTTIIPEPKRIPADLFTRGCKDLFLRKSRGLLRDPWDLLPYLFPADLRIPCGQPALFKMPHLAQFAGLGQTWVLDMSTYGLSGTHKDLRSWAVLSKAIEHDIKHLALWTAGNAGLSLTRLVKRWNATVPPRQRKTVYCLMDDSVPDEIRLELRGPYCWTAELSTGSGAILSRDQLYNMVAAMSGGKAEREGYWQVTDGWDGVGLFMYSLLAQQCIKFLRDELRKTKQEESKVYVILPIGTGNILFGFIRGMERFGAGRAKLVAALPYGDHMMQSFVPPEEREEEDEADGGPRRMGLAEPEAPKLTGFYSPLAPCLWKLTQTKDFNNLEFVERIEVDRAAQLEVAARLQGPDDATMIDAEPSALIAFGALKELARRIRKDGRGENPEDSIVLVVNSGRGLMGPAEWAISKRSIVVSR
ncbi:MAG: hypothetical protein G01um101438_873 [Parcubacteria group bacterium Gr01-1014_38]|nr:MAG: hypothetical protein G01um101438_873 [Parcubacteria group bacterium Gr01-1014_38]